MSNNFEFAVIAKDRYSKVARDDNSKASKAIRPLEAMQGASTAFGKGLNLTKVASGFSIATRGIERFGSGLHALTEPLERVMAFGRAAGPLGILGGIVGVTGAIATLGARWGMLGFEISRTSQALGVSAQELQLYRGAANQAGVSSEVFTDSL